VDVEALDTALAKRLYQLQINAGRVGGVLGWAWRHVPPVGNAPGKLGILPDLVEKRLQTHRRDYSPKQVSPQTGSQGRYDFRNQASWCTMHRAEAKANYRFCVRA
jgi:hypothetical protein